jgi:hypothetical protein
VYRCAGVDSHWIRAIMEAGRWKSSRTPMRYGEEILAARALSS